MVSDVWRLVICAPGLCVLGIQVSDGPNGTSGSHHPEHFY